MPRGAAADAPAKSAKAQKAEDWRNEQRKLNPNFDREQAAAAKKRRDVKKAVKEATRARA